MFLRRYRTEVLIALIAIVIAACWWPIRMRFPFDDTYITFRYAANLAHGFGIVWNPGGAHTEGYTNFLLVLLLAPFSAMGWDLAIVSQAIGIVAVVISAIALYGVSGISVDARTSRVSEQDSHHTLYPIPYALFLAPALFLLDPFTWLNAFSGLETTLFTMWLLLAVWAFASERTELAFAFATLATITRPEGALMGMILLTVGWWRQSRGRQEKSDSPSILAYWVAAFVIPLAIYAGWKLWYFGNLLPNSFYVKVSQAHASGLAGLIPGRGAVRIFYESVWYLLPFAAIAAWRFRTKSAVQVMVLWCILLSMFYMFSELIQNEYQRFTNTTEVMLIILTVIGLANWNIRNRFIPGLIIVLLVAIQLQWSLWFRGGLGYIERTSEEIDPYTHIAEVLRSIPNHQAITLAWADAGRLPYYSGLWSIDPVGLNTNEIAHAHTAAEVIQYLMHSKPDLIIIPLAPLGAASRGGNDATRTVLREGHGLIGSAYDELARKALASAYKPIALLPERAYDLDLLVDTASPSYRDIVRTIVPRIGHDSDFRPPALDIR